MNLEHRPAAPPLLQDDRLPLAFPRSSTRTRSESAKPSETKENGADTKARALEQGEQ